MILNNNRPRYIRYFFNPDRHPEPTSEDYAQSDAMRCLRDISQLSGMARVMLWKMIAERYYAELRAELLKQRRLHKKQAHR